ncbi:presenilins-associated rhomboid-like protein, mitochondrial isoform X4 [Ctenopharyngodon idella]|uniref:presenilins-associated rhomboid-like protein, mitochondrial isoform X4 n=1 Tax=Ctenopharyngodon idella TaxID=7959 RepID=UPI0022308A32|nr:presenilins-associated rhomboid-like protein, mitochondrial isoform X4 [Ctenopharyngodon idella]
MAWRGCFMKCAKINNIPAQFLCPKSSRLTIHPQQRCGFRKAQRQSEKKRGLREETDAGEAEGQKHAVPPLPGKPPRKPDRLFRPLVFTVGAVPTPFQFTGCSFGTAAILQYESVKSRVQMAMEEAKEKRDKLREGHNTTYWHNWWNQLSHFQKQVILVMSVVDDWWSGLSEGQKTVTGIVALNTLILCCWRIPSMQRSLVKYFTSNPASSKTQKKILWEISVLLCLYIGSHCQVPMFFWIPTPFISGAIMTVLAAVCTKIPEAKLGIVLLPMINFTAGNALKALLALDTAGLLLGWRFFDHAAHLGGALFGVWYIVYGNQMIWRKREPLVKFWHELRNKPTSRPRPGGGGGQV